jgi:hypothetical protein
MVRQRRSSAIVPYVVATATHGRGSNAWITVKRAGVAPNPPFSTWRCRPKAVCVVVRDSRSRGATPPESALAGREL